MDSSIQFRQTPISSPQIQTRAAYTDTPNRANTLERRPETDTVQIQKPKKKKMSLGAKIAIGAGATITALLGTCILVSKHQTSKLKKLYKEKLILSNLPEKIEFKEAATVEEGIKFAKEVLKIPEVDKNFTLEALNTTNRGLVDVSNAYKGRLFMPRGLYFSEMGENTIAAVCHDVESEFFGNMVINPKYYEHASLNKKLNKIFGIGEGSAGTHTASGTSPRKFKFKGNYSEEVKNLAQKYRENPDSLSITEKSKLFYSIQSANNLSNSILNLAPLPTLRNNIRLLEENGIKVNIEEFSKLSTEKQSEKLKELFLEFESKTGKRLTIDVNLTGAEKTIYHEMGHLQDFAENLKKLNIADLEFNPIKIFKQAYKDSRAGKKSTAGTIEEVNNRWGCVWDDPYKKLLNENPEKFKQKYPDLYEFVTNQEIQQTAGRISPYAQSGIGEFIAEVHARLISGQKVPDDVMALYKKYNGPAVNMG